MEWLTMGGETTNLSVPKDHVNPLYDPDENEAVSLGDLDGWNIESGEVNASGGTTNKTTITFTENYIEGKTIGIGDVPGGQGVSGYGKAYSGVEFTTNGNGNIDGCIFYYDNGKGNTVTFRWRVMGVIA
jgi:hypothetical protein